MIANIHHRIQNMLLVDTQLSKSERSFVEQHLVTCANCRNHAELIERLEVGHWSPYRNSPLSAAKRVQSTNNLKIHLKRQIKRNPNLLSLLGWASFIFILAISLSWAFNILHQVSTSPVVKPSPVPFEQSLVPTITPIPQVAIESPLISSSPTPDVGNAADFTFEAGYKNRTSIALVDLNCDGQSEQLLTVYRIPTNPLEEDSELRDYLGVALQVPDKNGAYQSIWTYTFDHSSRYGLYHVELLPLNGCEQLLGVDGQRWQGNVGLHSLQVFRWDGNEMATIFEVPEGLLYTSDDEGPAGKVLSITTFTYGFPDPIRHTCDWTYRKYAWDGETFTLVDKWQQKNQPCGGAGG